MTKDGSPVSVAEDPASAGCGGVERSIQKRWHPALLQVSMHHTNVHLTEQ